MKRMCRYFLIYWAVAKAWFTSIQPIFLVPDSTLTFKKIPLSINYFCNEKNM
jgi:hypothetical protein